MNKHMHRKHVSISEDYNHFVEEYGLYDMNQSGTPELINDKLVECGDRTGASHSDLYVNGLGGLTLF